MSRTPLEGIRVVDFSGAAAGPHAAMVLALLGAEVIRVESKARPDLFRTRAPGYFVAVNLNKMGLSLNLRHPKGVEIAKRLVGVSDIAVENFRPGVMERLGLGYGTLSQVKPAMVMLSISAFGQEGPDAQLGGYAAIFAAMSGLGHLTGYPDGPFTNFRASADIRVGQYGALLALAALRHARRTGRGQHIDLSGCEALTVEVGDALVDYAMNCRMQSRKGNGDDIGVPHNCYRCLGEDRWISIAVFAEQEWEGLRRAMGDPQWTKEERFADRLKRWHNQLEVDRLIEEWTIKYTDYALMQILQSAGVAAMPSFNARQLLDDPHLLQNGFAQAVIDPKLGRRRLLGLPWRFSDSAKVKLRPGGWDMGDGNAHVLQDWLGMTPDQVLSLEKEDVL